MNKNLKWNSLAMLFMGILIVFGSCSKDKDAPSGQTMLVAGRVTTPSGKSVANAKVFTGTVSTRSNKDGLFILSLPAGNYNVTIQTGHGNIFKTIVPVVVTDGVNITLPEPQTVLKQLKDLAFIPGSYDQIETVIIDSLGYTATQISLTTLNSLSTLSAYGGLFLNCGMLNGADDMDSLKYANLLSYVTAYGSIYASDFAVECITGDGNFRLAGNSMAENHNHAKNPNVAMTCINPLLGGFIPDSSLCTQKMGNAGFIYHANVLDQDLINALGKDSLDLEYDLGGWEIVHSYDAPFIPIIDHPVSGVLALKADLDLYNDNGAIYFTSFHNSVQGINNDVETILNYIILNL
ncbi:MAG TPA: carboxypeptidase-like regulatory domain-containing protein [Bacteroidia bacterium]|nr:carboxypeptidase-like regulatory domain-containing protein [Bacteroidia bacterium]